MHPSTAGWSTTSQDDSPAASPIPRRASGSAPGAWTCARARSSIEAVCAEQSEKYCELAVQRLAQEVMPYYEHALREQLSDNPG